MRPLDTQGYSPYLEEIVRIGLAPIHPTEQPSSSLSVVPLPLQSALQKLSIFRRRPSSTMSKSFSSAAVHGKRVIIAGLDASGKSTFLYTHIAKQTQDVQLRMPKAGIGIECVADDDGSGNAFYAVDIGGCDARGSWLGRAVCVQGDAIIWVVDGNDRDRVLETMDELEGSLGLSSSTAQDSTAARRKSDTAIRSAQQTSPVAILVNKKDFKVSFPFLT